MKPPSRLDAPGTSGSGEAERYTRVAVTLHWAIAVFIVLNLTIGSFMESLSGALRAEVVRLHESFGVTVFILTIVRIAWRLTHRAPAFPEHLKSWERSAARVTHRLFYLLMIAMPISGWLIISANLRRPMIIYWTWTLPPFGPVNALPGGPAKTALHDNFVTAHTTGAWILVALLALHVAGALKHQIVERTPQLQRMWYSRRRQVGNAVSAESASDRKEAS